MKYIESFKGFLNIFEKSKDTYSYGCVMLYFRFPEVFKIQDAIDPKDIYEENSDRSYGLEDEPHVTLLYGLHSDKIKDNDVIDCCRDIQIGRIILHNPSLFENEKYDVLKFDAESKSLKKLNKILCDKFPYTNDYPDYHPHSTVAYLKKGKGERYIKMINNTENEFNVFPEKIVYSKPSGEKISWKINNEYED